MITGEWLRNHEYLAAVAFVVLSLALMGVLTLIERRFLQK